MSTQYGTIPQPDETHLKSGYGGAATDFARGNPTDSSPLAQSLGQQAPLRDDFDDSQRGNSVVGDSFKHSSSSTAVNNTTPSRSGTLRKKGSVKRTGSMKRSSSRKSLRAGSMKNFASGDDKHDFDSAFHTPIPTSGTPTEVLADRFQAWRQLLKSLIAYFREVQSSYETRAKALHKLQNTVSNITYPSGFITSSGLGEATRLLDDYHKRSVSESNKSREIEEDVIAALTGLRSDLGHKIKEIKNLSGDFKNSVDKERDNTRKEVEKLQAALEHAHLEGSSSLGKGDPYVVRLGVDRAVEKQIDEENYLHRAYLNLESSGRELESIVVGEIQKAYKALAGILRREGDDAYSVVENLRAGPISMPKDQEWSQFVASDPHFVSPDMPLRRLEDISYPGKDNPAAAEIRAGMLERKSKYLKSYTAGWYVLSPTHLHEFKSADKIYTQPPVMSLYLGDQRLGSHSEMGSSSHKFMLKGRQAGGVHKGHNWVFRAESHDTMLAWFNDIKTLTEGTAGEKSAFVQKHTRSLSNASERRKSFSSDGFDDDDADAVPYSADAAELAERNPVEQRPQRPVPGGRFPSDLQIPQMPRSPSDNSANDVVAAGVLTSPVEEYERRGQNPYKLDGVDAGSRPNTGARAISSSSELDETRPQEPVVAAVFSKPVETYRPTTGTTPQQEAPVAVAATSLPSRPAESSTPAVVPVSQDSVVDRNSVHAPNRTQDSIAQDVAVPVAGAAVGALGTEALNNRDRDEQGLAGVADTSMSSRDDTAKVLLDSPRSGPSADLAAIPAPLSSAEPGATILPEVVTATSGPIRPTASVTPAPDAPATRSTSTNAVKNAALVSPPPPSGLESEGANTETEHPLGGLEAEGAHETGRFPVIRHDTDISVSKLHVPGEFRSS